MFLSFQQNIVKDSKFYFILDSSIKYGKYSLQFAKNEVVRAYFYGERPITVFKKQNEQDLQKSDSQSITLSTDFEAFQDCVEHLKSANNSSFYQESYLSKRGFNPNNTIWGKDFLQELLQGGIQCQHLNNYKRKTFPNYLYNTSLSPCSICDWEYVPFDEHEEKSIFKISFKSTYESAVKIEDENRYQIRHKEKETLLALTCTPTFCMRETVLDKKCKVTFAIPFVIQNSFYPAHKHEIVYSLIISFSVILLIFTSITFYLLRRRKIRR